MRTSELVLIHDLLQIGRVKKKWAGDLKAAPAALYTHVQIRRTLASGKTHKYRIPLENFDRGSAA